MPMPVWISHGLSAFLALSIFIALIDCFRERSWPRLLIYLPPLLAAAGALFLTNTFLLSPSRQAFGGSFSPLLAAGIMFVGVVLGIAATYVFNLTSPFSWFDFARPLLVSPLILLPLIGSMQGGSLEPIQLVCFAILAFQNGFFWQHVLRNAKPSS
jgi:hypothetical protein